MPTTFLYRERLLLTIYKNNGLLDPPTPHIKSMQFINSNTLSTSWLGLFLQFSSPGRFIIYSNRS